MYQEAHSVTYCTSGNEVPFLQLLVPIKAGNPHSIFCLATSYFKRYNLFNPIIN